MTKLDPHATLYPMIADTVDTVPKHTPKKQAKGRLTKKEARVVAISAPAPAEATGCVALTTTAHQDVDVVPVTNSEIVQEGAQWHATARQTLLRTAKRLAKTEVPSDIKGLRTWTDVVAEHVKTGMLLYGIGNGDQQQSVSGGIGGQRRVLDVEVTELTGNEPSPTPQ